MILTFVSQNLQFGGLRDGEGKAEHRWPLLLERIKSVTPPVDFLLLQETWGWDKYGHKQLVQAMNDLDMESLPLPPANSGNGPAVLYRQTTVGRWQRWSTEHMEPVSMHGTGIAAFEVGLPKLLSVMSAHLNPFSPEIGLQEAGVITTRAYRYGPFAVIGGDLNYPPDRGPKPNYNKMPPYNLAERTVLGDPAKNKRAEPDRRIAWKFEQAGFVDVVDYLYEKTGDKKYLEPTAGDDRIDRFCVSKPLAKAIVNYGVISKPADASDHKGIAFQLDTDLIDTSAHWDYK